MANTGSITFRPRTKVTVFREDFFDICGKNHAAALVLGQMYYWHQVKMDGMDDAITHNEVSVKAGEPPTQRTDLWVYKQQSEMHEEVLGLVGERAIGPAFALLVKLGFLQVRDNPFNKWDKRKQFRFRASAVQAAINELPPSQDTQKLTRRIADTETQFRAFGAAPAHDRNGADAASCACVDAPASSETTAETTKDKYNPPEHRNVLAPKGPSAQKQMTVSASPPSLQEVTNFFGTLGRSDLAPAWYDHFLSNGWKVSGRAPMTNWEASCRNWYRTEIKHEPSSSRGRNALRRPADMQDLADETLGYLRN